MKEIQNDPSCGFSRERCVFSLTRSVGKSETVVVYRETKGTHFRTETLRNLKVAENIFIFTKYHDYITETNNTKKLCSIKMQVSQMNNFRALE